MNELMISGEYIRLDQLLKAANLAGSGGQAKILIASGLVKVNGSVVRERGKKIYPGDEVICDRQKLQVKKPE